MVRGVAWAMVWPSRKSSKKLPELVLVIGKVRIDFGALRVWRVSSTLARPMASVETAPATERPRTVIHPAWVRITHWINALAMLVMIGSGWEIYNASPLFSFVFPKSITLGGWLAGALLWHFAAMWVLAINGLVYVVLGLLTGRFRRKLWPIWP